MKIGGKGNVGATGYVKSTKKKSGSKGTKASAHQGGGKGDKKDISAKAKDLNAIAELLDAVPEIRAEMVVRLKEEIERGNYDVDAEKVAEGMIERALQHMLSSNKVV